MPFSALEMYQLVIDVDAYSQFVPWCAHSKVLTQDDNEQVAELEIAKGPIRKSFTTRNRLHPVTVIDMALVDGPFKSLQGQWRFDALSEAASRVTLDLEFEFSSGLMRRVVEPIFNEVAGKMVDAFYARAQVVYER